METATGGMFPFAPKRQVNYNMRACLITLRMEKPKIKYAKACGKHFAEDFVGPIGVSLKTL